MKNYPTDLSDSQWQFIKKTLQLGDRKRKHNLRSIWNAIHYLVKTGCQWRMLLLSFAKWQLVYYYYKKWSDLEQFDLLLAKFRERIRVIIADGGYRGEIAEQVKKSFGYLIQVVMRSDDKKTGFQPTHKRWVVERTFAWFDNDRRLCRNYELLLESSENMVKLAAIKLLLNKI